MSAITGTAQTNFNKVVHFQKYLKGKWIDQQLTFNIRKGQRIPTSKELFNKVRDINGSRFQGFWIDVQLDQERYSLPEIAELILLNWDTAIKRTEFPTLTGNEFRAFKEI